MNIKAIINDFKIKRIAKSLLKKTPEELEIMLHNLTMEYLYLKSKLDGYKPIAIYLTTDERDMLEDLETKSNHNNLVRSVYLQMVENKHYRKIMNGGNK